MPEKNSLHKYLIFFVDNLTYEKNIIWKSMSIFKIEIWIKNHKYSRKKIENRNTKFCNVLEYFKQSH